MKNHQLRYLCSGWFISGSFEALPSNFGFLPTLGCYN
jgi:hypothetical protein